MTNNPEELIHTMKKEEDNNKYNQNKRLFIAKSCRFQQNYEYTCDEDKQLKYANISNSYE